MFFKRKTKTMQTQFDVYRNGELLHKLQFNYDVSPQKLKHDMENRDDFKGPLLVVKKPAIKTQPK